jgi:hypothetical protein
LCWPFFSCALTSRLTSSSIQATFPETIDFLGIQYLKASENFGEYRVVVNYLPENQTLEEWEEMITIHYDGSNTDTSVKDYLRSTEGDYMVQPNIFGRPENKNIYIDALLWYRRADIMEQNIIAFFPVNSGFHSLNFFIRKRRSVMDYYASSHPELFRETFVEPRKAIFDSIDSLEALAAP